LNRSADVVARLLEQFHEPVLDLDVVVGAGKAKPRRPFERPLALGIELADEILEVEAGHGGSLEEKSQKRFGA